MVNQNTPEKFGLPRRPFLYTLDQIAVVCHVDLQQIKTAYVYYQGRSTGVPNRNMLKAHNIAPVIQYPDWRVEEKELMRWMKLKGFRGYAS